MNQPAIRDLAVTLLPGFAALAMIWRAPATVGDAVSKTDSQGITTEAGGRTGVRAR
jgi:hypothetical protein